MRSAAAAPRNATIESFLTDAEGRTRVTTVTDLALTGKAAQFGRGLIQDVTAQMLESFADCLERQLATPATDADGAGAAPEPVPEQPRPVSGLALGAAAMKSMLGRHPNLTAGIWASLFFVYLWLGMLAVGVSGVEAFVLSALLGGMIFVFVRVCSEEDPARIPRWARMR